VKVFPGFGLALPTPQTGLLWLYRDDPLIILPSLWEIARRGNVKPIGGGEWVPASKPEPLQALRPEVKLEEVFGY
jgi:hypothetical protein